LLRHNTKKDSTGNSSLYRFKINLGKVVTGTVASKDSTTTSHKKNEMDLVDWQQRKNRFPGLGKTFVEAIT
jgi:hypothetical protein